MKTIMITLIAIVLTGNVFAKNNGEDPARKFRKWETNLNASEDKNDPSNAEGTVWVAFDITDEGKTEHVEVIKGADSSLYNRAIELVESMPKEHLYAKGFIEGTRFILPVRFTVK